MSSVERKLRDYLLMMKSHRFVDHEKNAISLSLLNQVGSAHDNMAFIKSTLELNHLPTVPDSSSSHHRNHHSTTNKTDIQSTSISFHQINYHVGSQKRNSYLHRFQRKIFPCCKSSSSKQILFDVNGAFTSGMNAILGPSGCGKSSLLDILADRKDKNGLSGQILVAGKPRSKFYKYKIGYVVQEDIISGILSVRENLMFSANLRLSTAKSQQERIEIVNRIIIDLGLERCADTRIGTHFIRGVSGGEKRRACIGMELVLSPKILFLDEPTSGLDSSTAESVMKCLHQLSRQGCTIVFSIHQPRYSIFKLFDTVLLLSSGHPVYLGASTDVLPYFSSHGFKPEEHDNPADFALDILIACDQKSLENLRHAYAQSQIHLNDTTNTNNDSYSSDEIISRSNLHDLYYVCLRTIRNTIRDPAMAASQIIVAILLALLTGLVFNQIKPTVDTGVQNRLGVIFFIIVNQIYSTTTALEPLVHERALFIHENASGYYRVSIYFIAKLICDLLPMRLIPSIIYSAITYFMVGLQLSYSRFLVFFLTIFISTIFGSATCFFVASSIPIFVVSLIIVVFLFVVMMVFSGFLIDLKSVFSFLQWLQWLSAFRYATNLLTINEFQQLKFCLVNQSNICPLTGEEVLAGRDISHETGWNMWSNFVALLVMIFLFLTMTYIQLLRMKKYK